MKYVARVSNVREVSILGRAELAPWVRWLATRGLVPVEEDGFAQILVMAAEMKFWGIHFGEISFSVLVECPELGNGQGAFLLEATNSNRFFAWTERNLFSTPYGNGAVRVVTELPASVRLARGGDVLFEAGMNANPSAGGGGREPAHRGSDGWSGPVLVPEVANQEAPPTKAFLAEVTGETSVYPFAPEDRLEVQPASDSLRRLCDSGFAGIQWSIRAAARHLKSKTYRRADLAALLGGAESAVRVGIGREPSA